jgi:hypothetical protein
MSGVLKLIEMQRAMWDIKGRLEDTTEKPGRYIEGGVAYGPCLHISRECGSGGLYVARMASERLGWQMYDREIVDNIAQLAHARQNLVESVDERIRSKWEDTWRPMLNSEDIASSAYLHYLREVVMTLGHHGDVVMVGRGAQYLLPTRSGLRVRLVAPLSQRIKRTSELKQLSEQKARAHVQQLDSERAAFIQKNFHSDSASPLNYDLVINTSEIGFEATVEIILKALQRKLNVGENRKT